MTPTTFKRDRPDVAQATHLLSRDEARRIALNIANLVDVLRKLDPTRF